MIAVGLYALVIGAGAYAVAELLEEPVRRSARPVRGLWIAAMLVTACVPLVLRGSSAMRSSTNVVLMDAAPDRDLAAELSGAGTPGYDRFAAWRSWRLNVNDISRALSAPGVERAASRLAGALSALLLLALGIDALRLRRVVRRSIPRQLDGTDVLVSANYGPAVLGVLHPRIVIPEWVLGLPAAARALVVRHERQHVAAHDVRLLGVAYGLLAIAPWNPLLWLQVRRLRRAIESDCDRRVLGYDARDRDVECYGALLIDSAARTRRAQRSSLFTTTALLERRALLRRRIQAMTESTAPLLRTGSFARAAVAVAVVLAACTVTPPAGRADHIDPRLPQLPAQIPDAYVADSIVADDETLESGMPPTVGAARDLPSKFAPIPDASNDGSWACDTQLRDPRDGTQLLLKQSVAISDRRDGVLRESSVGFYHVSPDSRYGVGAGRMLRVGCSKDGSRRAEPTVVHEVTDSLRARFGVAPRVTQRGDELSVEFSTHALGTDVTLASDSARAVGRQVWRMYGGAADIARIAVSAPVSGNVGDMHVTSIKVYSYRDKTRQ